MLELAYGFLQHHGYHAACEAIGEQSGLALGGPNPKVPCRRQTGQGADADADLMQVVARGRKRNWRDVSSGKAPPVATLVPLSATRDRAAAATAASPAATAGEARRRREPVFATGRGAALPAATLAPDSATLDQAAAAMAPSPTPTGGAARRRQGHPPAIGCGASCMCASPACNDAGPTAAAYSLANLLPSAPGRKAAGASPSPHAFWMNTLTHAGAGGGTAGGATGQIPTGATYTRGAAVRHAPPALTGMPDARPIGAGAVSPPNLLPSAAGRKAAAALQPPHVFWMDTLTYAGAGGGTAGGATGQIPAGAAYAAGMPHARPTRPGAPGSHAYAARGAVHMPVMVYPDNGSGRHRTPLGTRGTVSTPVMVYPDNGSGRHRTPLGTGQRMLAPSVWPAHQPGASFPGAGQPPFPCHPGPHMLPCSGLGGHSTMAAGASASGSLGPAGDGCQFPVFDLTLGPGHGSTGADSPAARTDHHLDKLARLWIDEDAAVALGPTDAQQMWPT